MPELTEAVDTGLNLPAFRGLDKGIDAGVAGSGLSDGRRGLSIGWGDPVAAQG